MRRVCIFCGSQKGDRPSFTEQAQKLGQALVGRGLGLVFGGGHIGLMGVIADTVLQAGGEAIGVIPKSLVEKELAHEGLSQLHVVPDMHQRKALMADLSDGFIALPGGFGTGDELFEILTWAQLGLHDKPIGILNVAGYFDPLLAWLDRAVEEKFLKTAHRKLLIQSNDPDRLLESILNRPPWSSTEKWIDKSD
ncbi:MAG TPA: TIGR00730 family Rossman fold protein [Gemmataceae bacterium]|jgi:hypothetical protein|nr:TIGR00730 family Rossman fold protein [Gemmataceae bacterium]